MRFHSTLVVGALLALTATAAVAETGIGARRAARHDLLSDRSSATAQPSIDGRFREVGSTPRLESTTPILADDDGLRDLEITPGGETVVLRRVVASLIPFHSDVKTVGFQLDRRAIHLVTALDDMDWDQPGMDEKRNLPRARVVADPVSSLALPETK